MKPKGIYYDRRKNFYKNENHPRDKIVGIPNLAQAVMAMVLGRPDTARARPSSLLKSDSDYEKIFNTNYPIEMYYKCAAIILRVESFLKSTQVNLTSRDRNNIKYYVAMHIARGLAKSNNLTPQAVAAIDLSALNDALLTQSLNKCMSTFHGLGGSDQVAKGPDLRIAIASLN